MSDPLNERPGDARELFKRFAQVANGFSHAAAIDAALNLVINAVRQSSATRANAESLFGEQTARARAILSDCYGADGKRRGVFAFDQHVAMDHFDARDRY
jgi:hypothetical protein